MVILHILCKCTLQLQSQCTVALKCDPLSSQWPPPTDSKLNKSKCTFLSYICRHHHHRPSRPAPVPRQSRISTPWSISVPNGSYVYVGQRCYLDLWRNGPYKCKGSKDEKDFVWIATFHDRQPSDNAEVPRPDSHSPIGPSPSLVSIDHNSDSSSHLTLTSEPSSNKLSKTSPWSSNSPPELKLGFSFNSPSLLSGLP
ncbi:hypothetical protein PGTUg99_018545 [Puccinia graminis f. sp. tritici]|uniref:Uncharacterized protein n=1 Tax=Puccinia graminis f. sp. tritici TaxID=56615 RepID=A0A5B0RDU1_PUCGR|nr:hypothetical protein PGTUg99_018545 [Puccinia graminis f. sp. tritici]